MKLTVSALLTLAILGMAAAALPPAPATLGFGVAVPFALPIDWAASFSYIAAEILLAPHLTVYGDIGVYPSSFPDLVEGSVALLAKAWVGPVAAFVGGGASLRGQRVGNAWSLTPLVHLRAGTQIWVHDALAVHLQIRTLDALPLDWAFAPQMCVGISLGLGRARPETPRVEFDVLWVLVGLATAALVAFLPRT